MASIQMFNGDMDKDMIILLAARASRLENQDAIDTAIVNMLADPKEVGNKRWVLSPGKNCLL